MRLIEAKCPGCGAVVEAPAAYAGREVTCMGCHKDFVLVGEGQPAKVESAIPQEEEARPVDGFSEFEALLVGTGVLGLCGGLGMWIAWGWIGAVGSGLTFLLGCAWAAQVLRTLRMGFGLRPRSGETPWIPMGVALGLVVVIVAAAIRAG